MNLDIKALRSQLGAFLSNRRRQMGRTDEEVGQFVGVTASTIRGVETGRFACDVDLLLKLCAALEIKPIFAPLEEIGKGSFSTLFKDPDFLFAPDSKSGELYLLHRSHPACLIHIIQTTPVVFRIVDNYSDLDADELAIHPFLEKAKQFYKDHAIEDTEN